MKMKMEMEMKNLVDGMILMTKELAEDFGCDNFYQGSEDRYSDIYQKLVSRNYSNDYLFRISNSKEWSEDDPTYKPSEGDCMIKFRSSLSSPCISIIRIKNGFKDLASVTIDGKSSLSSSVDSNYKIRNVQVWCNGLDLLDKIKSKWAKIVNKY